VWDAAGKVVKNYMRNSELTEGSDNRFATALDCSLKLRRRLRLKARPWLKLEEKLDARILQKTFFTVTGRKFGYATEDRQEWMLVSREHRHTVFTDRINVPRMDPIDGTLKLHMVSGTWERGEQPVVILEDETRSNKTVKIFKLKIASMPCVCTACRGEATQQETCIFKGIRNEGEEWIHETLANEQKPVTSREEKERFKLVFLQCSERLHRLLDSANMLGDGSTKITVKIMKDFLRLRSQPTFGRKHELAKRIVELSELAAGTLEVPVQGPLAAAYNIEGDDDLDAGGDDESVE
jgi:hypothetical protein